MTIKENFTQLLKDQGYVSLYEFCLKNQMDYANMSKRLNGTRQKIEISFMFKLATILRVPVEKIIEIFYPDEWKENRSFVD